MSNYAASVRFSPRATKQSEFTPLSKSSRNSISKAASSYSSHPNSAKTSIHTNPNLNNNKTNNNNNNNNKEEQENFELKMKIFYLEEKLAKIEDIPQTQVNSRSAPHSPSRDAKKMLANVESANRSLKQQLIKEKEDKLAHEQQILLLQTQINQQSSLSTTSNDKISHFKTQLTKSLEANQHLLQSLEESKCEFELQIHKKYFSTHTQTNTFSISQLPNNNYKKHSIRKKITRLSSKTSLQSLILFRNKQI